MKKLAAGIVLAWAGIQGASGQDKPQEKGPGMIINGATLGQLADDCFRQTKKRFVWDDQIHTTYMGRKVHVAIAEMPKNNDEYFAIFQSILQVNTLAAVATTGRPGEELYKIVIAQQARGLGVPPDKGGVPNDSFVTRIFKLEYISTTDIQFVFQNLAMPGAVVPVASAGALVVTDFDYNIRKIEEIIKALDVKKPDIKFEMIPLKHALASDVEGMLKDAVQALSRARGPQPGVPVMPGQFGGAEAKIAADKRTNSLVVLADAVRMDQIKELVQKLDIETPFETSGFFTVHLRHTNAVDIVRTLNALYGIGVDDRGIPTGGGAQTVRPGQPVGPTPTPGQPGTPGPSSPAAPVTGAEPRIVADVKSNAVIIITDRNTAIVLQQLIKRLDQRRPQVLIKATVVEVRATDNFDLGIELGRAVDPENHTTTFIHSNFGQSAIVPAGNTFDIVPLDTAGLTLALVHDRIGNIGMLLKALKEKANINILDEPEAATVDNGNAKITVTTAVPVIQTQVLQSGQTITAFKEFVDATTTLTISPHISEGGYLRLDTSVKIEKFLGVQVNPTVPPAKSSREISTNAILVPNGRTVVIGGIVTTDSSATETKIPLLGDIPILGLLFRRDQEREEKRTLYIFITPYIMYDDGFGDLKELTKGRKEQVEAIRSQALRNLMLEGRGDPVPITAFRFRLPGEGDAQVK